MAGEVHVKGLAELNRALEQLPAKIQKNAMRSALRAGAKVIQAEARRNIRHKSGALAKATKIGTRTKGGKIIAYVRNRLFYARFVEFGTKPHFIAARGEGALSIGGVFRTGVFHPGIQPRPFLRPAIDTRLQAAVVAMGEALKARLTKQGLDVADVLVEGDEP